jgi:hypothetical protein
VKNWKGIKQIEQKKATERLNKYVDGICKKYPERYMDAIRRDIKGGKVEKSEFFDEEAGSGNSEEVFENVGFKDDESLDRLISHIKLDKEF